MATPLRCLLVEDSASDAGLIVRALAEGGLRGGPRAGGDRRPDARGTGGAGLGRRDCRLHACRSSALPAALALLQQVDLDLPFIVVSGTIGEQTAVAMMKAGAARLPDEG